MPKKSDKKFDEIENEDYNSAEEIIDEDALDANVLKKLRERVNKAVSEKQEYLDGWQRTKADFVNYKKGEEERRNATLKFANEEIIGNLLPVLDSFNMAKENSDLDEGMEGIYKQLISVLEKHGLKEINPEGENFNPNFHEAVEMIDGEEGKVINVLQKGYSLNNKIIRPARVRVGK